MKQPGLGKLEWLGAAVKSSDKLNESESSAVPKTGIKKKTSKKSAKGASDNVEFVHEEESKSTESLDEETQEEESLGEEHDIGDEI